MSAIIISWSQLRTHEMCKQKAYLVRNKKKSPIQDISRFFAGTVADRLCRRYLMEAGQYDMEGSVLPMFEEQETEAKAKKQGVVKASKKERATMVTKATECVKLLKPMLDEMVLPYDYQPERRFRVYVSVPSLTDTSSKYNLLLLGGVDIVVRVSQDPDVYKAYDLKTTRDAQYVRKMAGQAVFYDLVQQIEFGQPYSEFGFIQPLVTSMPYHKFDIDREDRSTMLSRISAMADDIARGIIEPKEATDWSCDVCEVKHACAKFDPVARPLL